MDSSGSHKVVQIPEDTFRKMRDKLKKQDERIKSLEDQIISMELDKGGGAPAANPALEEANTKLNERIQELEKLLEDHKRQVSEYKIQIDQIAATSVESTGDAEVASVRKELEEKEELVKFLMEREKQLLTAIDGLQNSAGPGGGGGGSQYLEKGVAQLNKLENEMNKREQMIEELITKIVEAKEIMEQLKQRMLALPSYEEMDNTIKQILQSENNDAPAGAVSYEALLERMKNQIEKTDSLNERIKTELESIDLHKTGLLKRFDYLAEGLDAVNKAIKDKGDRLISARDFVEQKYAEWKAQDEARAREMSNLFGLMQTES